MNTIGLIRPWVRYVKDWPAFIIKRS